MGRSNHHGREIAREAMLGSYRQSVPGVVGVMQRRRNQFLPALITVLLVVVSVAALSGGASACACGEVNGPVVARGTSPGGLRWQINARYVAHSTEDKPYLVVDFTTGDPQDGGGYGLAVPFKYSGVDAAADGDLEQYSEGVLSGIADRRVVKLKMKMGNGRVLTVEPALAPARLRQRFFWLRRVRFFFSFFPVSGKPRLLTAFDPDGHMLGRGKVQHGHFFDLIF